MNFVLICWFSSFVASFTECSEILAECSLFLILSFPGVYRMVSVSLPWRPKGTATDHKKSDGGGRENQKQKFWARENVPPKHLCKVKPKEKTSCNFWLTIFRKNRVLLSCTVGPSFQNWIYEVMFWYVSFGGRNKLFAWTREEKTSSETDE